MLFYERSLLEIIQAEVSISGVPMNTSYTARGNILAWVEVFAGPLTMDAMLSPIE